VSPSQGRILIYVWAIEQDELSQLHIPTELQTNARGAISTASGRDVFVPWVMLKEDSNKRKLKGKAELEDGVSSAIVSPNETTVCAPTTLVPDEPQIFNRFYHMFAKGELAELVRSAGSDLGLHVGPATTLAMARGTSTEARGRGLEIVQDGWEKSNHYVELRRWEI